MMTKILSFDQDFLLCSIPVVVTTAELFRARFDTTNVPLSTGKVGSQHLKVEPIDFCGVNYHANDNLCLKSEHVRMSRTSVKEDVASWQRRTIFVIRAERIDYFLSWLNCVAPSIHG